MGIYGTVLTGQIDINVLEFLCLKKFSQKIEKQAVAELSQAQPQLGQLQIAKFVRKCKKL